MPIDVTTLREDLDNHKREIVNKTEEQEEWKRIHEEADGRYQKSQQAFDAVQTELYNLVTNSESDAHKLNNLLMEFPKLKVGFGGACGRGLFVVGEKRAFFSVCHPVKFRDQLHG